MDNGLSYSYKRDESILHLGLAGFTFDHFFKRNCSKSCANSVDTDKTLRPVASDLGLHYLFMSFFETLYIMC